MENNNERELQNDVDAMKYLWVYQSQFNGGVVKQDRVNTITHLCLLGITCAVAWGLSKLEKTVKDLKESLESKETDENNSSDDVIDISGD